METIVLFSGVLLFSVLCLLPKVRANYSAAHRIFNSLLGVNETLSLVFDILRENFDHVFTYPSSGTSDYNC